MRGKRTALAPNLPGQTRPLFAGFARSEKKDCAANFTGRVRCLTDPGDLDDAELQRRGIRRLPDSLGEALDNLERDELLMEALGPVLAGSFLAVKRSEYRSFAAEDVVFEIRHHFHKF